MATDPAKVDEWFDDYLATPQQPAATATAAPVGTSTWAPDQQSTVAHQVGMLTAQGSPLIDQAQTAAKQQANQRGMLNSTMAITAGQDAAYRAALPIASQDAATFANAGQFNAAAQNQAMLTTAGLNTDVSKFNAGAANQAQAQQSAAGVSTYQQQQQIAAQVDQQIRAIEAEAAAQGRALTAAEQEQIRALTAQKEMQATGITADQQAQQAQIAAQVDAQIRDIEAQAAAQGRALTAQEQAQIRELEAQKQMQTAGFDQQTQMQQAQFDQQMTMLRQQTEEQLKLIDAQGGTQLAESYRAASQSTYDAYITDVQRIQESDMDPDVKAAQIENLQGLYSTRQEYLNTIYAAQPAWSEDWSQFAVEFGAAP